MKKAKATQRDKTICDTQGRFLGTLGDEHGAWEPREESCPDTAVDVDEE
jgi:hypothetical protein